MANEDDPNTLTEKEIIEAMFKVRAENLGMWGRLIGSSKNEAEEKSLYRYREGFDNAILNLAKALNISLKQALSRQKDKEKKVELKNLPICSRCNILLFKKKKNVWVCPSCDMKFLLKS